MPTEITSIYGWLIANTESANAVAAIGSVALAAIACVVSIISLWVARSSLVHQRVHNRLSVRPLAFISLGDYENRLHVTLQNNGVGPLIIKRIRIPGAAEPEKALITAMPELGTNVFWTTFVEDAVGRSIKPGSELVLLDLDSNSSESKDDFTLALDRVRKAIGALTVEIEYTDIYGTSMPKTSRSMSWFHRHFEQGYA